jgi:uncharacterized membrane protein
MKKFLYPSLILIVTIGIVCYYAVALYDFSGKSPSQNDASLEYNLYRSIVDGQRLSFEVDNTLIGAVTTTWLPALIQRVTHIEPSILFRYYAIPLIIWLPLIIYFITKRYLKPYQSFLVSILFVSQPYYMIAVGVSRIIIATTFLALGVWIILKEVMKTRTKVIYLSLLAILMSITHCGTAIASIAFLIGWITLSFVLRRHWFAINKYRIRDISIFLVVLCICASIWFGLVAGFLGAHTVEISKAILKGTTGTTSSASGLLSNTVLGINFLTNSIIARLEVIATWLVILSLILGFIVHIKRHYLFTGAAVIGLGLLGLGLVSPVLSSSYGIQRIYFHFSFLLLPFAIYGLVWISQKIRLREWILPVVLTGFYITTSIIGHFV